MKPARYDYVSLGLILFFTGVASYRWEIFPLPVDVYYHLGVMKGFDLAGGVVIHDFWNFAPSGRVHLYPPFLHLVMLFFLKMGINPLLIGKITSFAMYPLSLFTMWFSSKKVFGDKIAFYSTMLLAAPFAHFRLQGIMIPAGLVLSLVLLVFYCIEKGKLKTGVVLFTFCLYSHMTIGHLAFLTFILYGLTNFKRIKIIFIIAGLSYLLYLPWGIHFILNLDSIKSPGIHLAPQIYIHQLYSALAIIGLTISLIKRKGYLFPLAFLIGLFPIFFTYPSRFMQGHSLIPLSMLGGVALATADGMLSSLAAKIGRTLRPLTQSVFLVTFLVLLNLWDPIMLVVPSSRRVVMADVNTNLEMLLIDYNKNAFAGSNKANQNVLETVNWIQKNTREDEVFYIDNFYLGALVTSLTGRSQSWGMLPEVRPKDGRLILEEESLIVQTAKYSLDYPGFKLVQGFGNISIYRRLDNVNAPAMVISKTVLPWWAAFILIGIGCLVILSDTRLMSKIRKT